MFNLFLLFLGLGILRVSCESEESEDSKTVHESQMSGSTLNKRWLKSRSAGRDLSLATTFDSEVPDNPDVPSDFDAKYGLDKNRFKRTPYPILSRRASYEDYGKAPNQDESIKTEEISFDFSSSVSKKKIKRSIQPNRKWGKASSKRDASSLALVMAVQPAKLEDSTSKIATTLKTLENLPRSKLAPKVTAKKSGSSPKPATDSKLRKDNKGTSPKLGLDHKPTNSTKIQQNFNPLKTETEVKRPDQAVKHKQPLTSQKNQNPPKSPLQAPAPEVKPSSNNTVVNTTQSPSTEKTTATAESNIKRFARESLSYAASHLFGSRQKPNPITTNPTESSIIEKRPTKPETIQGKTLLNPQNTGEDQSPKYSSITEGDRSFDSKQSNFKPTVQIPSPALSQTQKFTSKPNLVTQAVTEGIKKPQPLKPSPSQQQPPKQAPSQPHPPKPAPSQQPPSKQAPYQQSPKSASSQLQPQNQASSQQQPPKPVPSQQQPPKPAPSQQQPPKLAPSQQQPPKPVPLQQQLPKPAPSEQQPPKPVPSQQQPPKPAPSKPHPPKPSQQPPSKQAPYQQSPKPVSSQPQPKNKSPSLQQPPKPVPSQQQPPKPAPSQQQPPKLAPSQQHLPKPVLSQQQPPNPDPSQQQPPKPAPSQQQPPKPVPSQQQPPKPASSQQQHPKLALSQPQPSKPAPSQQQPPKPTSSQQQLPNPAPSQQQPPKPVLSQQQPPNPAPSQQQPPKPAPSQQQPPKSVPSQQQPPKPASSQQQHPKPTLSQPQPPKPAPSQQQPPKPTPSQQQPPNPAPSQQQPPKSALSQPQPPKPAPSKQQPPNTNPLQTQPPKPAPSSQQPPKLTPSQQQPPKPAPSQQQPKKPALSQPQPPKPIPSKQQPPNPAPSQPQPLKPTPSQQQSPKPVSPLQHPNPVSLLQRPYQSPNVQQETMKPVPPQNPPLQPAPQVPIKPFVTQLPPSLPKVEPQATSQALGPYQSVNTPPQTPAQETIRLVGSPQSVEKPLEKGQAFEQPSTPKETPLTPSPTISKPPTDQKLQMPTKQPQFPKNKPVSSSQSVTAQTATMRLTTVKVAVNQESTLGVTKVSTNPPQGFSTTKFNSLKSISKSVENQEGTFNPPSSPKPISSPLITSKPSTRMKNPLYIPAESQSLKPSPTLIVSPSPNPISVQSSVTEASSSSSPLMQTIIPVKATVHPVQEPTPQPPITASVLLTKKPTQRSISKESVTRSITITKNPVVTIETVATQPIAASQQLVTESPTIQIPLQTQNPVTQTSPTQMSAVKLTDKESKKPVATEQTATQSRKTVLTEQTTVSQPTAVTIDPLTTQTVTVKSANTQLSTQSFSHPLECHTTPKPTQDITQPSIHKTLTVASSKKKTTVRPYDKILNKAGDMLKPKASTKTTTEKVLSTSHINQELTEQTASLLPRSSPIKDPEPPAPSEATELHEKNSMTAVSIVGTTPVPLDITPPSPQTQPTVRPDISQQLSQRSSPVETPLQKKTEGNLPKLQTPPVETPLPRNSEDVGSKLNRPKGRRFLQVPSRIVLKPPPEDWPQPEAVHGAKQVPVAPEFTSNVQMGTYVDAGKRKSGFKAESFVSPPYMGHVKIDLMPAPEKPATVNKVANETLAPSAKWRIRGRKDRPTYGGFQRPGLSVSLTMKPSSNQFFTNDNITYITPSVRSSRPFRTYINFRQRGPMNVGRLFGPVPPPPPFPQPQPPPQHFHNPPFQAPFPQHPQFPHPPFPPFPRGPPPPRFGPPPHHHFSQPRPPPPFAPFPQGPPPPHPHFQRGPPPPHPQYGPPFPPPTPPRPVPTPYSDLPPPPPSPYPTGVVFPTVRPFYENIPTISPIDNVPAPWPRRQVYMGTFQPKAFIPRNFSDYKGPRRGRAYEQFGKADLRPKRVRLYDDLVIRGTPRSPIRRGSGYGVEFQTDVTRPPYVPGPMFMRRTWPTRGNRFGYEPYRRSSDRKRPFGGFGRYGPEKPPVLGGFGQFKPYRRLDFEGKSVYNFSRPTRSYTFPPRLQMAIRNATYQRRSFRRFDRERFDRQSLGYIPSGTYKSYGLGDYISHDHDHYGNLITRKGRIMNMQDLKRLFIAAPLATAPGLEAVESLTAAPVEQGMEPLKAPVAEGVEPLTASVAEGMEPLMAPVAEGMEPLTAPVAEGVEPLTAPVAEGMEPITAPVAEGVEPLAAAPVAEGMEPLAAAPVVAAMESATAAVLGGKKSITVVPFWRAKKPITVAPVYESLEVITVIPKEAVNKLLEEFMKGKPQAKPVGMTAKEALRAAAREAIRDAEMEAYDRGETIGGGLGRRRKGGFRPRGERGRGRGRGRGGFRFGTGARNFRRAKRSVDEIDDVEERQTRVRRDLRLYDGDSGDYLTGPGAHSGSSGGRSGGRDGGDPPLRMRRFHPRRGKGRPLRWG